MYNTPQSRYPAKVVVRFYNRKAVNFCMDHRDDLQQKAYNQLRLNLRFFSSLCPKNQETLRICKWLKQENRIHDHYIRNGFVKVVDEEHGRPWKASNPSMLRKKFEDIPVSIWVPFSFPRIDVWSILWWFLSLTMFLFNLLFIELKYSLSIGIFINDDFRLFTLVIFRSY